ncbi:MAG: transcriptional regulator [Bergeyella sp.]
MSTKLSIDEKIFCNIARLYGKTFFLPPLAAKIYAYMVFDFERKGLSFDDLVETFGASKSSVSTSLNLLLSNKLITDINKLEERRRYFIINEDFVKIRFEEILGRLREEVEIIEQLEGFNPQSTETLKKRNKIHKSMLKNNIKTIEESLTKLSI